MLEQSLRKLFQQQAEEESPPGQVTVGEVLRQGRLRRRRRRIGAVGTPVLAASAALAVALSGALPTAIPGLGRHPASSADASPREFNAAQVYARLSWLPARTHLVSGSTSRLLQVLVYAGPHMNQPNTEMSLTVEARGTCHVRYFPGSLLSLMCLDGRTDATARAPDINGHQAFWTYNRQGLIWEYGTNGWAILTYVDSGLRAAKGLRIAAGVRFGQHAPIKFASRLTAGHWQIPIVSFQSEQGVDLATQYFVAKNGTLSEADLNEADSATPDLGQIWTAPYTPGEFCPKSSTSRQKPLPRKHLTIHGYKFTLENVGRTKWQLLCGPDEDGLYVRIYVNGSHPPVTPAGFMERLQLLGTDPADWVTNPLP